MEIKVSICLFGHKHPLFKKFDMDQSNHTSNLYFALFNEKKVQITRFNTCREFFMAFVIKLMNEIDKDYPMFKTKDFNFGMFHLSYCVDCVREPNGNKVFDEEKIKEVFPKFKKYIYLGVRKGNEFRADNNTHKDTYEIIRKVINNIEESIGLSDKTKIHYDGRSDICIFRIPKNWFLSPEALSFYSLMIRTLFDFCSNNDNNIITMESYIAYFSRNIPITSVENQVLLLNNKTNNFFSRFIFKNYKKKTHNDGFFNLIYSKDFNNKVEKFKNKKEKVKA